MSATICMNARACGENCACAKIGECLQAIAVTPVEQAVLKVFGPPCVVLAAGVILATAFAGTVAIIAQAGWLY